MSSYTQWVQSPERKVGNGLKMIVLGIAACCVPGGQVVGVSGILGGIAKIGGTVATEVIKEELKKKD